MAKYNSKETEPKWIDFWEKEKIYSFNPDSEKPVFSIDTPPPTVSGRMHIGHAFSYSQMDFIARYKRLRGYNIFYPFGTDDNGLATERLIENAKKVEARELKREDFVKLCLETLVPIRKEYLKDFKSIGLSCDWDIFYTTINEHCRRISQRSFIELYEAGREYRKEAPAIWCPECGTAIAQVEMEDKTLKSYFNDIIFKIDGKNVIISTTRPELLPACVAVFVHPEDTRHKGLIGKEAKVPLFDFKVPVLADSRVDPAKGSGVVMCCTFGDSVDAEWYKAYNLPLKVALTRDGRMTELAGKYKGLKIKEAREKIIEDLKKAKLLVGQKEITHTVNVHERCGTEVEIIQSKQWFIKYLDLKKQFLKLGKELKWHPPHMFNRLENWIKGLQWDWCISRQRFFGVPFPVWYCHSCGEVILAEKESLPVDPMTDKPPVERCPKCGTKDFVPETDVLDTWATSSLSPRLAIELFPKKYWNKLFPMSLRSQAHDIISFWLFNTLVKSYLHFKSIPWKEVMISGWALDPKGEKMSKSKGNVVEPSVMLAKYSADALRWWAASTKLGEDSPFQEKEFVAGEKFVIKLWNAARLIGEHIKGVDIKNLPAPTEVLDKWILTKLAKTIEQVTKAFENYEYNQAKKAFEKFFWSDFCDNYLELVKNRLYEPKNQEQKASAQSTLYTCLSAIVRLIAPITPFITEEVYQSYLKSHEGFKSVHIGNWPVPPRKNSSAEKIGDAIAIILSAVRKKKTEAKLSMKAPIKRLIIQTESDLKAGLHDLQATLAVQQLELGKAEEEIAPGLRITVVI